MGDRKGLGLVAFFKDKIKWEKRAFPTQRVSIIIILALLFLLFNPMLCNCLPIIESVNRENIISILVVFLRHNAKQ